MNRRTFLRATALSATVVPFRLTRAADAAPADEELLAEARARIARHRRRPGTLMVKDAAGRPVPGANVRLEQVRHEFLFGCNCFLWDRSGDPETEAAYRERFANLFNFATLGFYWSSYEPRRGSPNYEYTDRVLVWAREQGIVCKGHPLVWDHPAGSPRWLPEDDSELAGLVQDRVREIVGRFKGRLDTWDVVNEATHLPDRANKTRMARWGEGVGSEPYTRRPLELARTAHPSAQLLVNDYRIEPRYLALLQALRDPAGKLLYDAVGIQSHMHAGGWPLARIWKVCDTYRPLEVPLHFTEATVVSGPRLGPGENWGPTTPELEARQADYAAKFYTMLFAHPAVAALTWWDLSDRGAWQRAAAGLVRQDMSPKPAYERLQALVRGEWWTRFEATTDARGEAVFHGFHGTLRATATAAPDRRAVREFPWAKDGPDRVELTLGT